MGSEKFRTYTVSDDDATRHGGRLGAGDEFPFLPVTHDEESGVVHGYVFTPAGIHYVQHHDVDEAPADEQDEQDQAEPAAGEAPASVDTSKTAAPKSRQNEGTKTP